MANARKVAERNQENSSLVTLQIYDAVFSTTQTTPARSSSRCHSSRWTCACANAAPESGRPDAWGWAGSRHERNEEGGWGAMIEWLEEERIEWGRDEGARCVGALHLRYLPARRDPMRAALHPAARLLPGPIACPLLSSSNPPRAPNGRSHIARPSGWPSIWFPSSLLVAAKEPPAPPAPAGASGSWGLAS